MAGIITPPRAGIPRSRSAVVAVSVVIALMALAGCSAATTDGTSDTTDTTTGSPDSTGSPAPAASDAAASLPTGVAESLPRLVAAPASAAEAVIAARTAVEDYNDLWNEIRNNSDLDPLSITAVASDQGASVVVAEMQNLAAAGIRSEGVLSYGISTAAASSATYRDGTVLSFGSVDVSGCLDVSGITSTNADGSAADVSDVTRYVWDYTVLYGEEQGSWFVVASALPEVPVAC